MYYLFKGFIYITTNKVNDTINNIDMATNILKALE